MCARWWTKGSPTRRISGAGMAGAYRLLRPFLFALPPEAAHALALAALRHPALFRRLPPGQPPVVLGGVRFPNRLGVAAGLDKDAVAVAGLAKLGFGFVEVGTVTPRPQAGNPKPRLYRLRANAALINRMGFNSAGAAAVAANLRRHRAMPPVRSEGVPVGVNIGKNLDTPLADAGRDHLACFEALYNVADFVTVNVSSPNTPGLRDLQAETAVRALTTELVAARKRLTARADKPKPLLVKVSPDLDGNALEAAAAAALGAGADGLVAVNTTLTRPRALRGKHAAQAGGLSGAPLRTLALETVRRLRRFVGDDPILIGVGGVSSVADMRALRDAGADLVQVYTGMIYRGFGLPRRLLSARPGGRV